MKRGWILPKKRPRPRSGIRRQVPRIWPRHRRFVKGHMCCVPGCTAEKIDFAHIRSAANAGKDLKPFDWFGVSLCRKHHDEQHTQGVETFQEKYGIDLWASAAEFAARSPDILMRAAMSSIREAAPWARALLPALRPHA
jgi:putative HNHc nuclease